MTQQEEPAPGFRPNEVARALAIAAGTGAGGAALAGVAALLGLGPATAVAPVGITVFCIVAALYYWKTQQALLSTNNGRAARAALRRIEDSLAETQGLVQLGSAGVPFPLGYGGTYALTADAAAVLAREVAVRRPRVVVELGSGVSTVLVGRLLQQMGEGRIYSLEHDGAWAAESRAQVAAAGLGGFVDVLDAPLVEQQVEDRRFTWYSIPDEVSRLDSIDLLIVDGPPQRIDPDGLPRYPALPLFAAKLSESAAVFVDDAKRAPEAETVRLWLERFPGWQARWGATVPGTFVLSRTVR